MVSTAIEDEPKVNMMPLTLNVDKVIDRLSKLSPGRLDRVTIERQLLLNLLECYRMMTKTFVLHDGKFACRACGQLSCMQSCPIRRVEELLSKGTSE